MRCQNDRDILPPASTHRRHPCTRALWLV